MSHLNRDGDASDALAAKIADIVVSRIKALGPLPTEWLTPEDAADYLRLSKRGLEDMRAKGTGPKFCKVDRVVRYHVRDLDGWLLSNGGGHE